jgi:CHAT domain-containing protein
MKAGAPTVVSSLWVVDDLSTALLMERFYIYHLRGDPNRPGEGRLSPPIALRRAQQWLRDKATAKVVSDICFQKAKTLSEWEDLASELAEKAFIYKLMPPNSCPFAHPIFWAPFTISGQ